MEEPASEALCGRFHSVYDIAFTYSADNFHSDGLSGLGIRDLFVFYFYGVCCLLDVCRASSNDDLVALV